jgi:PTS system nitrogen regulatory IIA component
MLLARESLASTGVGDGIAIPHVRYSITLHPPRPMLSLCFLENAIDFNALDGRPVRVLCILLSPTIRGHLILLSKLGFALRDPGFKETVLNEGSREDILREARRVDDALAKQGAAATREPSETGAARST